ncbi:MAG TPA: phosphotransferase family protein [Mycobacteriales bacterium]|nr:phosphotransferase family protein [Mycobacteriales bacterium]
MTTPPTPAATPIQRTSRDPQVLRARLETWLRTAVGDPGATADDLAGTAANGMSSDTVLFRATWSDQDGTHDERLVARIAPDAADVPVFPSYDMRAQFETIRLVHELTDAPVPTPLWCEPDPAALGAPFFVMRRVDGQVPPDVLPYPFGDNWLYDADPADQRRLQDATVDALAAVHSIRDAATVFPFLDGRAEGDTPLRRHVAHTRNLANYVAAHGPISALITDGFEWLDRHWPDHESGPVLSWGDSRIGNVIYADFAPAALLDWEMAGLGPRELDVVWLFGSHLVFQHLTELLGLPGMPDFLRPGDVIERYAARTGHEPRDLDFYLVYAVLQWAIVLTRTGQRQVHFGEREAAADPDDYVFHKELLRSLLTD